MTEAATPIDLIDPVPEAKPRRKRANGKELAVQIAAPAPATIPDHGDAFLNLVERAARDTSVDLDKLQKLLDMREKIDAQARERAFNDAMAAAQAEMRPVATDAANTQTKSKYASYAALDRVLRPIYTKHGFALSFNTSPDAPADYVRMLCDVTNCGHSRRYQIDMPADGKGARGGDVMTKTHATGSAASYGMRYLLKMIFNIAVAEADDDGNAAGAGETITDAQCSIILDKIAETEADIEKFCNYFKIDGVAKLPAGRFNHAMNLLNQKGRKA